MFFNTYFAEKLVAGFEGIWIFLVTLGPLGFRFVLLFLRVNIWRGWTGI